MRRLTLRLTAALLALAAGPAAALSAAGRARPQEARGVTRALSQKAAAGAAAKYFDGGAVDFRGVSFTYDRALASRVRAEVKPASPLTDKTHKPDYVEPAHVAFTFTGAYADRHEASFFSPPALRVYRVADYKRAFAVEPRYVARVGDELERLKQALARRPESFEGDVPFLYTGDGSQVLRARVRYADFRGGRGILFVTQYDIEAGLVTNRALTYLFAGLTDDGRYYVAGTFPVSAAGLPDDISDDAAGKYGLAFDCLTCPDFRKKHAAYLAGMADELGRRPPEKFRPALNLFDDLIGSLRVR